MRFNFENVLLLLKFKFSFSVKKDTRELQGGEANLLRRYKLFLQKLEKLVTRYLPRQKPAGSFNLVSFPFQFFSLVTEVADVNARIFYFRQKRN